MRLHVAVAIGIEDAELHRVHADEMRELVHLAFEREVNAGDAEAAHRSGRRAVGEDAVDVTVDVRDRIGTRQMRGAFDDGIARQPRIGAGIEIAADLARDDAAIAHHAVLDVDALGAARRPELHLFLASEHIAHRPPGQHRGQDGERLGQGIDLAAKAAADSAADEVEGVRRQIEDLGAGIEREEQRLGRGVDDVAPIRIRRGNGTVGFDRRVLDRRHLVTLLQHMIGLGKTALDIAEAQLLVVVALVINERVLRIGLVDRGRARLQRLLDVEHGRQVFVIDAHLGHRFGRRTRRLGDDSDDGFAAIAHLVDGERRLVILAEIDQAEQRVQVARHVAAADDPPHALAPLGLAGVDAAQPRMRLRRPDDPQMQHALQLVIVEICRGARDVAEHVLTLGALADLVEIVVALVGEDVLAQFQHGNLLYALARRDAAAASTALMIGS